jgi:(2Fe-2S) ferredoxin
MPQREHYVFVCLNRRPDGSPKGSCAAGGSEAVYDALRKLVAERKLNKELVRVCSCSCLDLCHTGPAICVEPEHVCYGKVTVADVPELVDALAEGRVVERLRLSPELYDRERNK